MEVIGNENASQPDDPGNAVESNDGRQNTLQHMVSSQESGEDYELLRAVIEAIPDAVFVKDLQGRYRMINSAGARFIGKLAQEIIGQDDSELFSPESAESIMRRDREIMRTRRRQTFEEDSTADGVTRTYLGTKDVYCDAEGKVIGLIGIARDITERKRAKEDLNESRRYFQAIFDNSLDAILVTNDDGRYLDANRAACLLLGYSREELLQLNVWDVTPESSHQFATAAWRDFMAQGTLSGEYPRLRKDGTSVEAEFRAVANVAPGVHVCSNRDVTERKRAEEALREAERKYRDIFDNATEGIFQTSPEGKTLTANPGLARMMGYASSEELIRERTDIASQHYVDPKQRDELMQLLEEHDFVRGFEYEGYRKDGTRIWLSNSVRAVRDEKGTLLYYEGTAEDITERRRAKEALRKSEERYRELFENAKDAFYVHDLAGTYLSVNRAAESLIGYAREDILGKNFTDFVSAEHLQRVRESLCRKLTEQGETTYEAELIARDGRPVPVEISSRLIFENGSVTGVQGMARDITERKRAEDALRKTEQEQRQLAQYLEVERARLAEAQAVAKVGSWELDLRHNVLTWSNETYRIFGMDRTRFGASYEAFLERVHPDDRAAVHSAYTDSVANHRQYSIDHRMQMEDGSIKTVHERCRTYYDDEGRPVRSVGTCQDITRGKRAEEALRESEERFSKAFHSSPAALSIALLEDGHLLEVNASFLRITGYDREDVIGRTTVEIGLWASPDRRLTMAEMLREQGRVAELEIRFRRKSGEIRDALLSADLIELSGAPCVLGIAQDVTERKRAEEQLKTREAQLMDAQSLAHIGSWEWDIGSDRVTWSDELYRIWRLQPDEFAGTYEAVLQMVHPDDRDRFATIVEKAYRTHEPYTFEHRVIQRDGAVGIMQARGSVILDEAGHPLRMFGTSQDITKRRLAEDEIKATNAQLRALSESLRSAREEEGARIARELHDELGSALTSLNWSLEEVDKTLAIGDSTNVSALREKISGMAALVDTTIDTVRRISSELRPSVLDDLGLVEAIEWQAKQFQTRTGIICDSVCSLESVDLNRAQSTAVFRICQEALTNILRHAEATKVNISVQQLAGEFFLQVSDNGKGITDSEVSAPQSLGLLGMKERAHLVGGEVSISGAKGHGTSVTVRVPLSFAAVIEGGASIVETALCAEAVSS